MKALLVVPPDQALDPSAGDFAESLGVSYLSAYARQCGFTCDVLDSQFQQLDIERTIKAILNYGPDVLGITASYATSLLASILVSRGLRASGFNNPIIVGGYPATFSWRRLLTQHREIDAVCLGEGEQTFVDFLTAIRRNWPWDRVHGLAFRDKDTATATQSRPLLDIDCLPTPDRDELSSGGQPVSVTFNQRSQDQLAVSIATSRGCPFNCSFCSVAGFYRQQSGPPWRGRSRQLVVDEILEFADRYNDNHLAFIDDNLIGSSVRGKQRAEEIAKLIIASGQQLHWRFESRISDIDEDLFALFKQAGLEHVNVGIESLNPDTLKRFNKEITVSSVDRGLKILKSLGISFHPNFILFEPDMTLEELRDMLKVVRRLRLQWTTMMGWMVLSTQLSLLPGTNSLHSFQASGRVRRHRFVPVSNEGNDLLYNLGLTWEAVPLDPRMDVLQKIHLRTAVKVSYTASQFTRVKHRLRRLRTDSSRSQQDRDKAELAYSKLDTWLSGLGAVLLTALEEEVEVMLAHTGEPSGAVDNLESVLSGVHDFTRSCLGDDTEGFLTYCNCLLMEEQLNNQQG